MNLPLLSAARQRGISLIEGVLYLVIALAVIVGGIVFFQQAQLSNQVTDTARAAVGISSQTRGLYQNQRAFNDAGTPNNLTATLIASGSVPSNFLDSDGDSIVHPFGNVMQVFGSRQDFVLQFTDLSEEACLRLATAGQGGTGPLGTGITGFNFAANATPVPNDNTAFDPTFPVPVTATTAANQCSPDPNNAVDVQVFYSR